MSSFEASIARNWYMYRDISSGSTHTALIPVNSSASIWSTFTSYCFKASATSCVLFFLCTSQVYHATTTRPVRGVTITQ